MVVKARLAAFVVTAINAAICAFDLSPLQVACCAVGLSPPIRTSGSRNANAGDQKFRCLSRRRVSKFPPECVPQMLARRARGSGGDSPTAQQVAYQYNELKARRKIAQFTNTKFANSPSNYCSKRYKINSVESFTAPQSLPAPQASHHPPHTHH